MHMHMCTCTCTRGGARESDVASGGMGGDNQRACMIEKKHQIEACSMRFGVIAAAMTGPVSSRKDPWLGLGLGLGLG